MPFLKVMQVGKPSKRTCQPICMQVSTFCKKKTVHPNENLSWHENRSARIGPRRQENRNLGRVPQKTMGPLGRAPNKKYHHIQEQLPKTTKNLCSVFSFIKGFFPLGMKINTGRWALEPPTTFFHIFPSSGLILLWHSYHKKTDEPKENNTYPLVMADIAIENGHL
jgi:hypothetical protein